MCISMDVKIRHNLIEIEYHVSDRCVILIYERDFDEMSLVINFRIDKWTESMLSITSSQKCSLIHLLIPIVKLIGPNIQNA